MTGQPTFSVNPVVDGNTVIVTIPVTADAYTVYVAFFDDNETTPGLAGLWFVTNSTGATLVDVPVTIDAFSFDGGFFPGKQYYPFVWLSDSVGTLQSFYSKASAISASNYTFTASDISTTYDSGIARPYLTVN